MNYQIRQAEVIKFDDMATMTFKGIQTGCMYCIMALSRGFLSQIRMTSHGKEISCHYFYEDIIVQFLVNPTQNYHLHTGKPAQKNFSSNFFVHHPLSSRL